MTFPPRHDLQLIAGTRAGGIRVGARSMSLFDLAACFRENPPVLQRDSAPDAR